ncbi:DUF222 domain-containing protein [Nocardia sp. NPDC059229]|uniref:HNH endonuclease signature motif containing protein n=1 Tax=Nocardia sp. NPDC059229 TaxID=3346778 RepID=UPI003693CAB6
MNWGGQIIDDITAVDAVGVVGDALDVLIQDSLGPIGDDDLLDVMREWESHRRRMAAFEHKLIREVENRNLPEKAGVRQTSTFLAHTLRLGHAEARARCNHDALVAFLRPEMGPTTLGKHRGLPVSTIITMSLAEVEAAAGIATTASGGAIPLTEALQLAQRLALIATERGCTRPGCNAPATMTAVHHITEWAHGSPTDIDNLTLACDACHAMIHDGPGGWKTVVMPPDSEHAGRTGWIAPPHIDPSRTPQVNDRHHAGELMAAKLAQIRERTRPPVRWWSRP